MAAPWRRYCQIYKYLRLFYRTDYCKVLPTVRIGFAHSRTNISSKTVSVHGTSREKGAWSSFTVFPLIGILSFSWFKFGEKKESEVRKLMKQALLAQTKNNDKEAEHLYHQALKTADDKYAKKQMVEKDYLFAKTFIFDNLADMALARGELDTAERLYKETMKGCLQLEMEKTDNPIIELSIKLASIYAMMKRDGEAIKGYEYSIKAQEEKVREDDEADTDTWALLGLALESYARFLMLHGKLHESEALFEKSIKIAQETLGEDSHQTLVLLNDLATLKLLKKEYDAAEKVLSGALTHALSTNSELLPALYCNLGAVYLRKSKSEEYADQATEACGNAMAFAKKIKDMFAIQQAEKCLEKAHQRKERIIKHVKGQS